MAVHKKVVINNHILNGNPHIEDTRLTVFDVVSNCKYDGIKVFLDSTSEEISITDLRHVFVYCATRQCDNDGSHCGGCSLRPQQDSIHNANDFIDRFAEIRFTGSDEVLYGSGEGVMIMAGSPNDFSQNWSGEDGWLIAFELLQKIESI